jgi:hypothetical protein
MPKKTGCVSSDTDFFGIFVYTHVRMREGECQNKREDFRMREGGFQNERRRMPE